MGADETWFAWGRSAISRAVTWRGGNDTVLPSAESKLGEFDTLAHSTTTLVLAKANEEGKPDDPLYYLTSLFDDIKLEDLKEYEGDVRHEPVGDRSVPLSEPSISKKGHISSENLKVLDRDEEDELADRESVPSLVSCEAGSPTTSASEDNDSPRTESDFKSDSLQKDQVKVPPTSCRPLRPQLSKDQPTSPKQDNESNTDLAQSECDDTATAQPGADSSQECSDHPTSNVTPSALHETGEDEQVLTTPSGLITLEDTKDSGDIDDVKPKREREEPTQRPTNLIIDGRQTKTETPPPTAFSRGEGDRYYFYTSSGWHYFDDYRNVYSENGTLVHDASFEFMLDGSTPDFYICGVPYWFHPDGLLSQDTDSSAYYVTTWYSKYYFHTPNGLYYFDYRQNVYSDKGILVYDSSFAGDLGGLLPPIFYINGASYWFELNVLWCQSSIGTAYRVHTWQSEPNWNSLNKKYCFFASGHFYYLDDCRNLYSEDGKMMYNGSSSVLADNLQVPNFQIDGMPYWLHKDGLLSRSADDTVCRVLAWCGLNDNPDPLQKGLAGGMLVFSPGSSNSNSPNARSTTDDATTLDISLFAESDPDHIRGMRSSLQYNTAKKATKKAQPARKHGTKDHLRCPFCDKVCRRPVALEEHIRHHTGEKPNVCPFEDCNTGFATRSNMRRHFTTHRAECTLEEYERSVLQSTETGSAPIRSHNPYH